MIYAIATGDFRYVKIGFTDDVVEKRRRALSTANPEKLAVVASFEGDLRDERAAHDRFAHCRRHGEWFALTRDIALWLVERCPSARGLLPRDLLRPLYVPRSFPPGTPVALNSAERDLVVRLAEAMEAREDVISELRDCARYIIQTGASDTAVIYFIDRYVHSQDFDREIPDERRAVLQEIFARWKTPPVH